MKWIESTQGKVLVKGCSQTTRQVFTCSLVEFTGHDNRAADIVIRTYVLLYSYVYASTADMGTCTAAVTTNKAM